MLTPARVRLDFQLSDRLTSGAMDSTTLHGRRATARWERVSVGDLLERVTWSYPDKEAIVAWDGAFANPAHRRLTYRAADALANRIAHALLARGLARSDRVLLFCENSVEAYVTKIGVAKAGLVCVPVNPLLAPDVVAELIRRVEPGIAIVDAELWPRARAAFEETGIAPDVTIEIGGPPVPGSVGFDAFVAGMPVDEPDVEIHGDDIWQILFTSGTTALPKGAMLSHNYSYLGAMGFALTLTRGLRIECDLKVCSFLPIVYHVGDQPFSYPAFLSGGTFIIGRRPDPAACAEAIAAEGVTAVWAGSPAMLTALADALAGRDASSLTVAVYGWAALDPAVLDRLREMCAEGFVAVEIFGQTEAIACHRFWPDKWPETYAATAPEHNYVGVPGPLLASRIIDAEGQPVDEAGVPGEVVYRSPVITAGYYRDEEATAEAFRGGWFHSGDSCARDEDGLRVMLDRYKDIVKSGGENVSSLRVEAVVSHHPGVARAAVVGLPHERWGEAVTAFVVPDGDAACAEEELIAFCRERLAPFETPKRIVVVDGLPETVGGKVLKYKLRAAHRRLYDTVQEVP